MYPGGGEGGEEGGGEEGGVPVILTCVLRRHVALTDSLSSLRRFTHFTEGAESVRPQRRAIWLADRCVEIRNLNPLGKINKDCLLSMLKSYTEICILFAHYLTLNYN